MNENQKVIFYSVIAYLFSIGVGFFWVYQFWGFEPFMWNGQFMLNTNDGYYWAEGARDIIAGFHQENDLSPIDRALPQLSAFLYKITPFSFETIIFYMSRFLASLIVIPIILIARDLKQLEMGFIAALLSSIAWSYYNRTLVGYYDTDMLNIVFPLFLLWSLIGALTTQKNYYLLVAAIDIFLYRLWYPQSYALEFSFFGLIVLYVLYKYFKEKKEIHYEIALLTIMLLAMVQLHWIVRIILFSTFYYAYITQKTKNKEFYIFLFSIFLFFLSGGIKPILHLLNVYVFNSSIAVNKDQLQLHFFTVIQTIREAGHIPFEIFANRISGHMSIFFLSLIGYGWLLWRYRVMLLSLPLVGLGFLAYSGGLRFTIYAIVPLAFGIAFLIIQISSFFKIKLFRYIFLFSATLLILLPNIYHAWNYKIATVFQRNEVAVLDKLKNIASREDYVLSWWDYGYPIRYYSDVKTLIDGGKHNGADNFFVSYILTNNQQDAAKLARFDVEYTENIFALSHQKNLSKEKQRYLHQPLIAQMTLDKGFSDVNDFLLSLDTLKLPQKTREIYFYLPNRMINIFLTIAKFSNIDLMTGKTIRNPFFLYTSRYAIKNDKIIAIAHKIPIQADLSKGVIKIAQNTIPINRFTITYYKDGKLYTDENIINFKGAINIIYMKNYNKLLFIDNNMYNSTFVQLFILEHFDKSLYEPVILTPIAKVYRLKV